MAWISIVVDAGDGPETLRVRARVFGQLAVHPDTGISLAGDDRYTITHIPTGRSLGEWGKHLEHAFALKAAARLSELDWDFKRPSTCQRLRESVRKIWAELTAEVDRKYGVQKTA